MIPLIEKIEKKEQLENQTIDQQANFGISSNDQAHVMHILRDQLYSDRILAVLREYTSNAWDANRAAGRGQEPIEVTLPTDNDPTLTIKDHGMGLSKNDVFNVYTQYGASTKRESNDSVGMLGIGSKSGFAYSNAFTVISRHNGTVCTYKASLDATDVGVMQLLHENACEKNDTGIEIKIPVKNSDINSFIRTAQILFEFFEPKPKTNIELPSVQGLIKYKNGYMRQEATHKKTAIIGCIPYEISSSEFQNLIENTFLMSNASVILFFDIGEIEISANREQLKYTENTRKKLLEKLTLLSNEIDVDVKNMCQDTSLTDWDKILKFDAFSRAGINVTTHKASYGIKQYFYINVKSSNEGSLYINYNNFPLIIRDTRKAIGGFKIPSHLHLFRRKNVITTLLTPSKGYTTQQVKDEIEAELRRNKAFGMPIKFLSEFEWVKPYSDTVRKNKKVFKYTFSLYSSNGEWESIDNHKESKDDVYVILSSANRIENNELHRAFNSASKDKIVADFLKIKFPTIIGYKVRKSSKQKNFLGQTYANWQQQFYKNCFNNVEYLQQLELSQWEKIFPYAMNVEKIESSLKFLIESGFNENHDFTTYLNRAINVHKLYIKLYKARNVNLKRPENYECEAEKIEKKLKELYPIIDFSTFLNFHSLSSEMKNSYIEYIKLKDQKRKSMLWLI